MLIVALIGMFVCSCGRHKSGAQSHEDLRGLTADQLIERLIPKLPNPNSNYDGWQPVGWRPSKELLADNARVWHAREELDRRGTVVFGDLIEAINDDRYAGFAQGVNGFDIYPYTIAEHCADRIEGIVNPWHFGPHIKDWNEPSFLSQFVVGNRKVDGRPWFVLEYNIPKLREWWKARQQWSVQKLRLEVLRWREEDALQRHLPSDYLEKVRAEIRHIASI